MTHTQNPEPSLFRYLLVIDLEATCDENQRTVPRHEMEIIEIGAVLVDTESLEPVDELQTFIRPVRHPLLTPFCRQLTTITQADVDGAPHLPEAIEALTRFVHTRPALFCSWGAYDRRQLDQDAAFHGVHLPLSREHLNLKLRFSEQLGTTRKLGMGEALQRLGLTISGTHHRGIDDARNIARMLPWIFGRRAPPGIRTSPV